MNVGRTVNSNVHTSGENIHQHLISYQRQTQGSYVSLAKAEYIGYSNFFIRY